MTHTNIKTAFTYDLLVHVRPPYHWDKLLCLRRLHTGRRQTSLYSRHRVSFRTCLVPQWPSSCIPGVRLRAISNMTSLLQHDHAIHRPRTPVKYRRSSRCFSHRERVFFLGGGTSQRLDIKERCNNYSQISLRNKWEFHNISSKKKNIKALFITKPTYCSLI